MKVTIDKSDIENVSDAYLRSLLQKIDVPKSDKK